MNSPRRAGFAEVFKMVLTGKLHAKEYQKKLQNNIFITLIYSSQITYFARLIGNCKKNLWSQ